MKIKNSIALSMAESLDIIENIEVEDEKRKELRGFIKKFVEISSKDAKKLREDIEKLNIIKIKQEHIANIIDLLPETSSELNKIFSDISLNEEETNKILDIVKGYR